MSTPGIEPGPTLWKSAILTTILRGLFSTFYKRFIYVLKVPTTKNGVSKTCYKVGYTSNLEKRLTTYKTGNPDIELVHQENVECNKKQLEKCVLNLNTLKLLRNKTEVICDNPLKEIITEINDCKELLKKHSH